MEVAEVGSSHGLENHSNQKWLIVRCYQLPPHFYSLIAQLVEQVTVNHRVIGSSPVEGARFMYTPGLCSFKSSYIHQADIAQLVEQAICNRQVRGSSPLVGTTFLDTRQRRRVAADCKSVPIVVSWFESNSIHQKIRN